MGNTRWIWPEEAMSSSRRPESWVPFISVAYQIRCKTVWDRPIVLPSSPTSLCHIVIHPCPSSHPYSSLPLWYIATFPMAHPSKTYWERHWWQVSLHGVISHICLCWGMSFLQMDLHKILQPWTPSILRQPELGMQKNGFQATYDSCQLKAEGRHGFPNYGLYLDTILRVHKIIVLSKALHMCGECHIHHPVSPAVRTHSMEIIYQFNHTSLTVCTILQCVPNDKKI